MCIYSSIWYQQKVFPALIVYTCRCCCRLERHLHANQDRCQFSLQRMKLATSFCTYGRWIWLISLCWALGLKLHSSQTTAATQLLFSYANKANNHLLFEGKKIKLYTFFYFYWSADGLIKQLYKSSHWVFIMFIKEAFIMCIKEKKNFDYVCFTRKLHIILKIEELLSSRFVLA